MDPAVRDRGSLGLAVPPPIAPSLACDTVFALVSNIPGGWTVADVRGFFSNAVEAGWFALFHYKEPAAAAAAARQRVVGVAGAQPVVLPPVRCAIRVKRDHMGQVMRMYNGRNWVDSRGEWGARHCPLQANSHVTQPQAYCPPHPPGCLGAMVGLGQLVTDGSPSGGLVAWRFMSCFDEFVSMFPEGS
jgi:hypothetical protein